MDANGHEHKAKGHELARTNVRRGVAFRVLARTGVDDMNSYYGIAL